MRYIHVLVATVLISLTAGVAYAAEGELPWGNFSLRMLNFAIFIGIIWYVAGKKIKGFLTDHRQAAIHALEEATRLKKEAIVQLEEAEARLRSIEGESNKLIEEGKKQGEAIKALIIAEAEQYAARLILQAKQAAEHEGMQERAILQAKIADEIIANVEKEISSRLDKSEHLKLVEKSLSKVVLS